MSSAYLAGTEAAKEMLETIEDLKKRGFNVVGEVIFRKGINSFSIKADELGGISLRTPPSVASDPRPDSLFRRELYQPLATR